MEDKIIPIGENKVDQNAYVECIVPEFEDEIESINEQLIKSVTQNIIKDIMDNNKVSRKLIDETKRVTMLAQTLAYSRGYTSLAKDVITAAALLHDLYAKKYDELHVFMIRYNHLEELRRLDPAIAENICSIIEGHHGYESIVPKIASKEGTIEQILTDAVAIVTSERRI